MIKIPINDDADKKAAEPDNAEKTSQNGCDAENESSKANDATAAENTADKDQEVIASVNQENFKGDTKEYAEKLEAEKNLYLDHLKRLQAEFENYRRRMAKEKSETAQFAYGQMAKKILPVLDNLERGLGFADKHDIDPEFVSGIRMVERQLLDVLAEFGVTPSETLGEAFDPNLHEPVYTVERSDVDENIIVEQIEKGYMLGDKVLRAAKVVVSRAAAASE